MAASFAGSRSMDERRRRRLASDAEEQSGAATATNASGSAPRDASKTNAPSTAGIAQLPLRKIISSKMWKLLLVGCGGVAAIAGILAAGWVDLTQGNIYGPGYAHLFSFENGTASLAFRTMLTILTGQLCLLIWWVRSKSLRDFGGQYRIWTWAAMFQFTIAIMLVADLHVAASNTVIWFWRLNPEIESVVWMLPVFVFALALSLGLLRDMSTCRTSMSLMLLSCMAWLGCGLWELDMQANMPAIAANLGFGEQKLIEAGLAPVAQFFLFFAVLVHARFVIHFSSEPPQQRASTKTKKRTKKSLFASKSSDKAVATPKGSADSKAAVSKKSRAVKTTTARKQTAKSRSHQDEFDNEIDDAQYEDDHNSKSSNRRAQQSKSRAKSGSGDQVRIDEPIDPNLLKGLSKRERRDLRKKWREQQRASQSGGENWQ